MTQALANVVFAFTEHWGLALVIAAVLFVMAIAAFSAGEAASAFEGMVRLLGSIFTAPFVFLRSVVQALTRFRADDEAEARSQTFLLWRSIQYALFCAFIVSMTIVAAGVTIAVLGVWPSDQLRQREELTAARDSARATYHADSIALATLIAANPAQAAKQRSDRLAQLKQQKAQIQNLRDILIDSLKIGDSATSAFVNEVWQDEKISNLLANKELLVAQTDSFVLRHGQEFPPNILNQIRRYVGTTIEVQEIEREISSLDNAVSAEDQSGVLEQAVKSDEMQLASIEESLGEIKYFGGISFFFTTLALTYLYLVGFVWVVGTAIEALSLMIGLSRDLAAIRRVADRNGAE